LQAKGLRGKEALPSNVDEMARDYLMRIREVVPHGPVHLLGWCFGGVVAHSIATLLQEEGAPAGLLVLLNSYPDDAVGQDEVEPAPDPDADPAMRRVAENNHKLLGTFQPARWRGDAILFTAAADDPPGDPSGWLPLVDGNLAVHEVSAAHDDMTKPEALAAIGKMLKARLERTPHD
jgi:thioesterase domain-containing protein